MKMKVAGKAFDTKDSKFKEKIKDHVKKVNTK